MLVVVLRSYPKMTQGGDNHEVFASPPLHQLCAVHVGVRSIRHVHERGS